MKLNVKAKLQLSFGVVLALLMLFAAVILYSLNEHNKTLDSIDQDTKMGNLYNDVAFQTVRANAAIRGYMLYKEDNMRANHYEIRDTLAASVEQLKNMGAESDKFAEFEQKLAAWEGSIDNEILPLMDANKMAEAQKVAKPVLGAGSQELVEFGKSMANEVNEEINQLIAHSKEQMRTTFIETVALALISIIVSIAISTIFARRIALNMQSVMAGMNEFAQGNLLTKLKVTSKDEFGQLASSFNAMADRLRDTMRQVGNSSEQVAGTSQQLTASSMEVSKATEVVTESIQEISLGMGDQQQMTSDSKAFSDHIMKKVFDISESIEQVNSASAYTKEKITAGRQSVRNVIGQMDIISDNTSELNVRVKELDGNTSAIASAVQVIKNIADQTNLLALNASIEAARAGEAGKGFAVVASEVRKLADESNIAATEIEQVVQNIVESTRIIEEDITNNDQSVDIGKEKVEETRENFLKIDAAIDQVEEETKAVTQAIKEVLSDVEKLVGEINDINEVTVNSSDSIQSVAAASEEQNAAMEEVAAASTYLAEMAVELQESIQSFKY
ncbi:methyl-accepting chemotaxis protein [Solibacillus daqui]|uniref:methyl-accepting chemotaxis protein n=1 Tax=Solibacillus daqui TaxID=2912187 RepID=UPI00236568BA|nr:methyl-accepting chemotaxis protein [Solibacillus daqui]